MLEPNFNLQMVAISRHIKNPPPSQKDKKHPPSPNKQAREIQGFIMLDVRNPKVTPSARAQLARAWLELERLRREILMKPKPKPIDVSALPSKAKKLSRVSPFSAPTEPTPTAPAKALPSATAKSPEPEPKPTSNNSPDELA